MSTKLKYIGILGAIAIMVSLFAVLPTGAATAGTVSFSNATANAGNSWYSLVSGKDAPVITIGDADEQTLASLSGTCSDTALSNFSCVLIGVGGSASYQLPHTNIQDENADDIPDALLIRQLQSASTSFIAAGTSAATGAVTLSAATTGTAVGNLLSSAATVSADVVSQSMSTAISNVAKVQVVISADSSGATGTGGITIGGTSVNPTTLAETASDTEVIAASDTSLTSNGTTNTIANDGISTKYWKAGTLTFSVDHASGSFAVQIQELRTVAARYQYGQADTISDKVTINSTAAGSSVALSPAETSATSGSFTETVQLTDAVAHHGKTGTEIFGSGGLAPITGTSTGSANASALTDSAAGFLAGGVRPGDTVANGTDGSSCTITGVTATTVTCTLSGGTENDWDASDAYSFTGAVKRVFVNDGATLTVNYADASPAASVTANAYIDLSAPTITKVSPSADYLNTTAPKLEVHVEDAAVVGGNSSGLETSNDVATSTMYIQGPSASAGTAQTANLGLVGPTALKVNNAKVSLLRQLAAQSEGKTQWWVTATDAVGNTVVVSGDDAVSGSGTGTTTPASPFAYTIDTAAPTIVAAEVKTGGKLNADTSNLEADVEATTSLSIGFDLGGAASPNRAPLDAATISAGDFTVSGATVSAAALGNDASGNAGEVVLLTLSSALATDATPSVSVSGSVKDTAGNSVSTSADAVTAIDALAPVITIKCGAGDCNSSATNATVTVDITSSEAAGTPTVRGYYTGDTDANTAGTQFGSLNATALTSSVSTLSTTNWQVDIATSTLAAVGNGKQAGVYVALTDAASNAATSGVVDTGIDTNADGAVDDGGQLFEFDVVLNNGANPTFTLRPESSSAKTDSTTPFIEVTFGGEASEYVNDSHGAVTVTTAAIVDSSDVSTDVLSNIQLKTGSTNDYILAAAGLGLATGTYTLKVTASDDAGNIGSAAGATEATSYDYAFEIIARPEWTKSLIPGMNLVSVPGTPSSSAVNDVFSDAAIELVATFDPASSGASWQSAQRNASSGLLEGNLSAVKSGQAYFVQSSGFVTVSVDIPKAGFLQLPDTVSLNKGWNLVPVIDVGTSAENTGIDLDTYFNSVSDSVVAAMTWNTQTNAWIKIQSAADAGDQVSTLDHEGDGVDDEVQVGRGYWVYMTEKGTLVP